MQELEFTAKKRIKSITLLKVNERNELPIGSNSDSRHLEENCNVVPTAASNKPFCANERRHAATINAKNHWSLFLKLSGRRKRRKTANGVEVRRTTAVHKARRASQRGDRVLEAGDVSHALTKPRAPVLVTHS
jgi:hypothetical protein